MEGSGSTSTSEQSPATDTDTDATEASIRACEHRACCGCFSLEAPLEPDALTRLAIGSVAGTVFFFGGAVGSILFNQPGKS